MAEQGTVRRRLVYYISGFDPRGPRFYHQLYKAEAALQQDVNGCHYTVGRRVNHGDTATSWTVTTTGDPQGDVETRYTFLRWDDIVRAHWPASPWAVARAMPAFYRTYRGTGALAATRKAAPRVYGTLLSPAVFALLTAVMAAIASGLGFLFGWWAAVSGVGSGHLAGALGAAAGLLLAAGTAWAALALAERVRLFWLMRILGFMHGWAGAGHDPHAQRWADFAARIRADLDRHPADEVLVVGHSVGAIAAIAVVDRLLAQQATGGQAPPGVKLLTLGQVLPLLGLIPQAGWFRTQLQSVGASDVPWLDCTAPGDPLSYTLVDPFSLCGLPTPTRPGYRIKSSRFDKMFLPTDYAHIRKDAFRIHFQYLMASQLAVDNDYFRLTAGAAPLPVTGGARA